jgi:hypothetical protein
MRIYQNNEVKFLSVIYILESDVKYNIIIDAVKSVSLNISHHATIHPVITHFSPQLGLDNPLWGVVVATFPMYGPRVKTLDRWSRRRRRVVS